MFSSDIKIGLDELELKAKEKLDKPIYDFIAGGAGNESSVTNNRFAFRNYHIVPRILNDVSTINTSFEILGERFPLPVIIGPCAFHKLVCEKGELDTAKAADEAQTIFTLSTMSSCSIEEVAEASTSPKWFQLYVFKNREISKELVIRAEKSGYQAIVLTVDVPQMGIRWRDIKNKFSLPSTVEAANFRDSNLSSLSTKTQGSKIKDHTDQQFDTALTWDTVNWLHSITSLPIILKGVLNPEDALKALKYNVSAIVVSNHGGRQIDDAIAPIDALPDIARATQGRIPLILDGGVNSGEDIFKAIALGAQGVMIARSVMWALCVGGNTEVSSLLHRLQEELSLIMRLSGCPSLEVIHQRNFSLLAGPGMLYQKIMSSNNNTPQPITMLTKTEENGSSFFKCRL